MSLEVDVRKLDLFNQMAREGSATVADHLERLTGVAADVRTSQINFLDVDDVRTHLGEGEQVGIYVELTQAPGGYVLLVLEPFDAKRLAAQMIGGIEDVTGFSEMERSALQEIGNILASGFIDGWANVLETTIDMTAPTVRFDDTAAIIEDMGGWPSSDLAFVVDSHLVSDEDDVDLTVYTFPELEDLVGLIQDIGLDTDVRADATADDVL